MLADNARPDSRVAQSGVPYELQYKSGGPLSISNIPGNSYGHHLHESMAMPPQKLRDLKETSLVLAR